LIMGKKVFQPNNINDGKSTQNNRQKRLTCIRNAYTLAATHEDASEVDRLMVKQFLDTLAEVALAVATRRVSDHQMTEVNK